MSGEAAPRAAESTRCGGFADSRLLSRVAVELLEVRAKLTERPPRSSEVTSQSIHAPARIGPEESTDGVTRGLLRNVSLASSHEFVETPRASIPAALVLSAKTRRIASETGASRPLRSKRRKLRTSGLPSVRRIGPVPKFLRTRRLCAYVSASARNVSVVILAVGVWPLSRPGDWLAGTDPTMRRREPRRALQMGMVGCALRPGSRGIKLRTIGEVNGRIHTI
jgi:hypothetical protein